MGIAICKSRSKEHKMASRQILLWAFLALMPFSIKGQNVTIDFPDKPHKLFNESLYDTASQKMRENARKLTLDQMDAFTKFGQALDANMAERIRNVTGLTATNSSTLEIELKKAIHNERNITTLMLIDISDHAIAMKQNYVKEVIKTINLKPSEFNLTAEEFCDMFDACQYIPVISSSTEKFGLSLTDHIKNITNNSNITQEDILQRRSDTVESTELEQEADKNSTTEVPETTESTETKDEEGDAEIKEEENEIIDENNNEIEKEKTDPKTDASTQESSSATSFAGLSKYLLLIFLVLPHM